MRRRERGGAVLLLAFGLLAPFAAAAFLAHRAVAREWALEGDAAAGTIASLGADAALAWYLREGFRARPGAGGIQPVPAEILQAPRGFRAEADIHRMTLGPSLCKLTVRSRLLGPGRGGGYVQVREAYVEFAAEGAPPRLRAWRIVR